MIEGHSYWNMRGAVRDTEGQRLQGRLFVFSQLEADTALLIEHPRSNAGPPAMGCFECESGFLENAWRLILETHGLPPPVEPSLLSPPAAIHLEPSFVARFCVRGGSGAGPDDDAKASVGHGSTFAVSLTGGVSAKGKVRPAFRRAS